MNKRRERGPILLKEDEKIVFSINSGFSVNGLDEFDVSDKCLRFTNLGNIIISKVDYLEGDYIKYSYSDYEIALESKVNGKNIDIISKELPCEFIRNNTKRKVIIDLLIVLDYYEFASIETYVKPEIFDFSGNETLMILGNNVYEGRLHNGDDCITFETISGKNINFMLYDIEYFSEKYNKIYLEGSFVIDGESIFRRVVFVGDLSLYKLPLGIDIMVDMNKKLRVIPLKDEVFVGKLWGSISNKTYNSRKVFIVKNNINIRFYDRYTKELLLERELDKLSKYELGDDNYIIYDELYVYRIEIRDYIARKIGMDKIRLISKRTIGYTMKKNPFFLEFDKFSIRILSSPDREIVKIDKESISDIRVCEELGIDSGDLVSTEIKYRDKRLVLNLKRDLIESLTENILTEYQINLLNETDIEEVYMNWVKSVSDIVIYNLFGELYANSLSLEKFDTNSSIYTRIETVNKYYNRIEVMRQNFDCVSISMSKILEKNEINYFRGIDKTYDLESLFDLKKYIDNMRTSLKKDLCECIDSIGIFPNILMESNYIDKYISTADQDEINKITRLSDTFLDRLYHFFSQLLPYYIEKVVEYVFEVYNRMFKNYKDIEEKQLKEELMNRIKSIHIFKQFSDKLCENVSSNKNEDMILRKELIDDMYSLIKFYDMKIDSEYYYTGLYRL